MAQSLTAAERETIIRTSDDDELVSIWTAQRAYITMLRKRAGVTEEKTGFIGTTEWVEFSVPRDRWSPIGLKRAMNLTDEKRTARADRLAESRK